MEKIKGTTEKVFVGIDFSMNSPAAYVIGERGNQCIYLTKVKKRQGLYEYGGVEFKGYALNEAKSKSERHISEKHIANAFTFVSNIKTAIDTVCPNPRNPVITLEGYSFGSTNRAFAIGEATGALKRYLFSYGFDWNVVPPTTIRKAVLGSGKASKEDVVNAYKERTGVDLCEVFEQDAMKSPCNDVADSFLVCLYGMQGG